MGKKSMFDGMNAVLSNVVVVDTETGGLDPSTDALMEVALVPFDGIGEPLCILVNDAAGLKHAKALEVNGLTAEMCEAEGVDIDDACALIAGWLENFAEQRGVKPRRIHLAGQNVGSFDAPFLRRVMPSGYWSHRFVDTHTILWALMEAGKFPPLPEGKSMSSWGFEVLGCANDNEGRGRHSALGDALATRRMLRAMLAMMRGGSAAGDIEDVTFPVLRFFAYDHLPPHLQEASRPFAVLAAGIAARGYADADVVETTTALRKLLEAKDAAVRALVQARG